MSKTGGLTKGMAIVGTVLIWFPILATVGFSGMRGFSRLDWLMPAELFPAVAAGGALLLWAAIRAHSRRGLVAWGLGIMVGAIVAGTLITTLSGLASGTTQPDTAVVAWGAALVAIGLYTACIVEVGIAGVLLLRDLFAHHGGAMASAG
jgi:hypothetical protein